VSRGHWGLHTAADDVYHQIDEWGNHARDGRWDYADPDVDEHMNGECREWALWHKRYNPHLRIGIEWSLLEPEERDHPEDEMVVSHAFTHDDHWAYDARGAFPLADWRKWKGWDDVTFNHEPSFIGGSDNYPRSHPTIATEGMAARAGTKPPLPVTPEMVKDEDGWSRIASTDGVRYAHIVEADVAEDVRQVRLAMAWDQWAPQIKGGCDNGCDHDRMMMGEYSIEHPDGTGPQVGDLLPGIKGRSLLQFTHDTDEHGNPEMYVSGIHVDEGHRRDGIAEALMRRMRQDHPDTPINPGFMTDMGEGLLDGLKKRIPGAGEALVPRHAAVNRELVDRLNGEFHDWYGVNKDDLYFAESNNKGMGPLGHWPNIEAFLADRYPAAHRDLDMGMEGAQPLMDGEGLYGDRVPDAAPYETGQAAVDLHGYDPREVAASMLLLHNGANPQRGDMAQHDQDRLNDIARKRFDMQRTYEDRTREAARRIAMPAPTPRGMTFHYYPDRDALRAAGRPRDDQPLYPPCVEARNARGNHVGFLEWHGDEMPHLPRGEINMVKVKPGYRRKGVATALLDFARQHDPGVHHSSGKTELGQMWADHEESRHREAALDPHDAHLAAARDVMHLHHYIEEGEHPDGVGSVLLHPRAHHPALTNHWAAEIIKPDPNGPGFGTRAQAATGNYVDALSGVVEGSDPGAHHQLENARNGLRVELQHAGHFSVPDLSQFSRLPRESDAMRLAAVNPRHDHGMEVPPPPRPDSPMDGKLRWLKGANARLAAYTINCQRACLALDSRHRGLNVEARPNYHNPIHDPDGTDEQWTDDEVADLWHDRHGNQPSWVDASDHFQLAAPGPAHWDAMTEHINSWGRGARALIAMTQADPTDPVNNPPFRHVIMARVGRDRKVRYVDPQIARADASDWRGRVMYGGHPLLFTAADREYAASLTDDHRVKNIVRNRLYSPLRYLRIDDAQLSPHAARHLVDRGTAGGSPIHPAAPAFPDLPGAPTPPSNPARDW
jgi:ribosomal protein S18 acetylase RimI-like enzyme